MTEYVEKLARYRDFFAVFNTEQGRRVLGHILTESDKKITESVAGDTSKLVWRSAQRAFGFWIHETASVPPPAVDLEKRPDPRGGKSAVSG